MDSAPPVPPAVPARRSPTLRAFLLFVLIFGALFWWEVSILFYRPMGLPAARRGEHPRLLGEIAGRTVVSQTFQMQAGGLSGVTVEAAPAGRSVSGDLVFSIVELGPVGPSAAALSRSRAGTLEEVARVVVPAADVVRRSSYLVSFTPIDDSKGKEYQLDVSAPGVSRGHGIALRATRDQAYRGGVLAVEGKEQWGDLVFSTHATRGTLFPTIEYLLRDKPAWMRSRLLLGALIVLYNWALATFTWYMLFVED
jgi:hypothetical protein